MIASETARAIAFAYREVEVAEKLLAEISETISRCTAPDIRDSFGRQVGGLELGVPSGNNGRRLFNVPWELARPVIEAHVAQQKAIIAALSVKARIELNIATPAVAQPGRSEERRVGKEWGSTCRSRGSPDH